jgi:hypothetical protein
MFAGMGGQLLGKTIKSKENAEFPPIRRWSSSLRGWLRVRRDSLGRRLFGRGKT